MDAKDLMIGDWVEVTRTECVADGGHYITWSEYGKVVGITDSYIEVEVRDGEYNVDAHEDELKPIPLTPEILEQNGFETRIPKECYLLSTDYYDLYVALYTDGLWEVVYSNCEINFEDWRMYVSYTHELQHALRLCGINKEIEI